MPRPEVLHEYYGVYYRGREHAVTFAEPQRFASHILKSVPPRVFGDEVRILDFGGGDGTLSKAIADRLVDRCAKRRVNIVVMDFPDPVAVDGKRITLQHRSPIEVVDGEFNLVLASGVLEHVPDLHPVFKSLFGAIARGGCFYARTPYGMPFTRLFRNFDLTYPAHVHDMGAPFWDRFIETFTCDAEVLASRPSIVESSFRREPLRSMTAAAMKFPAHFEGWISPWKRKRRLWQLVGGWEFLLRRN